MEIGISNFPQSDVTVTLKLDEIEGDLAFDITIIKN